MISLPKEVRTAFKLGFFPGPQETKSDFEQRMQNAIRWSEGLWTKTLELSSENIKLTTNCRLDRHQLEKDGQRCFELYGTCPSWVPAYTDNQGLPLLTGGMAVQIWEKEDITPKTWFQLKAVYRDRSKWLIYERSEIISHEMCHVARLHLNSTRYEETIAYGVSSSKLRKKLGGALLTPRDNLIFFFVLFTWILTDLLQLFGVNLGVFYWIFKGLLPTLITLGLYRNFNIQRELKKATAALEGHAGNMARAILFCLNDEQIKTLAQRGLSDLRDLWPEGDCYQKDFLLELIASAYDSHGCDAPPPPDFY